MTQPALDALLAPPAGVDPAFTMPERPAMWTQNIPESGEIDALLADRARLRGFLAGGYRLFREATSRTWPDRAVDWSGDPSFGQRSNEDARRATLAEYQWLNHYGPCLMLIIDRGLLDGAIERAYKEARI